ncbi:MAG: hypothetical protein QF464_20730, partial [Myxococcota bacterium]|nr:hypothetical protein [Myxococcota bacterium]
GEVIYRSGNTQKREEQHQSEDSGQGEDWTSRPSDGRYEWVLLEPGTYTITATTGDGQRGQVTITVGDERQEANIVVKAP